MSGKINVEFEITAFGEETIEGYESSLKKHEIVRIKNLPKETTLENIEVVVKELFDEVRLIFNQPEHLTAKVIIRAKQKESEITYLG